jgi:hypothetical protein
MVAPSSSSGASGNPFVDVMEALSNHHGQVDIRLERMSVKLPFVRESVEVSGTLSISVHLRELSEKERSAHVSREIRALSG